MIDQSSVSAFHSGPLATHLNQNHLQQNKDLPPLKGPKNTLISDPAMLAHQYPAQSNAFGMHIKEEADDQGHLQFQQNQDHSNIYVDGGSEGDLQDYT